MRYEKMHALVRVEHCVRVLRSSHEETARSQEGRRARWAYVRSVFGGRLAVGGHMAPSREV